MDGYDHAEHLHRFGCWAAAAAVRRGFITNEKVAQAIESIKLQELLKQLNSEDLTDESFIAHHKVWSKALKEELKKKVDNQEKVTYGRVAKIIAVYIKTCYVVPFPECQLSKIAHPPIDRILLTRLLDQGMLSKADMESWTKLNKVGYFILVSKLRNLAPDAFWKLEYYWKPFVPKQGSV